MYTVHAMWKYSIIYADVYTLFHCLFFRVGVLAVNFMSFFFGFLLFVASPCVIANSGSFCAYSGVLVP